MFLLLLALSLICSCGLLSLLFRNNARTATAFGAGGAVLGCLSGMVPSARILWTGQAEQLRYAWNVPYGSIFIEIDALSALFLIPILLLSGLSAVYGSRYMSEYRDQKSLGAFWFFFNILVVSMISVVIARNGILFLMVWEVMSLSSFFLVTFENEKQSVQRAGWIYLVATHLGTAFLFVLFLLLAGKAGAGTLDFDRLTAAKALLAPVADMAFILAVIGFGTKAGFIPLHVWLPEAHPAAPSHVSAVMSGVMIKTGIYGLLRTVTFFETPSPWWGWLLIAIGLSSGILGVLFALAQHDLKRLLAYHSVENIGIIALGLGLGLFGIGTNAPGLAVLGFGGGLLHILNHALFKGLLFLGAGSVLHATGTLEIDHLGGLIKRMPQTAVTFVIGAVAISGLPPLNGFISEFLIYVGAFRAVGESAAGTAGALVIVGLALIGGLAAACFTKAFGIVFLGEPRSEHAAHAHEAGPALSIPMWILAVACVLIGLLAPYAIGMISHAIGILTGFPLQEVQRQMSFALTPLIYIVLISSVFIILLGVLGWTRSRLLSGRSVEESCTWDCGYARPSPRMQYTASSFAQPITKMFEVILRPTVNWEKPGGLFPVYASLRNQADDLFRHKLYQPVFDGIAWIALRLRWLQEGHVQLYIFYIAVTLLILLIWNLR